MLVFMQSKKPWNTAVILTPNLTTHGTFEAWLWVWKRKVMHHLCGAKNKRSEKGDRGGETAQQHSCLDDHVCVGVYLFVYECVCGTGNSRVRYCRSLSLSTAPHLFASCSTSLQTAPGERHGCVKIEMKILGGAAGGGLSWEMIWLGEEKFLCGHLLSAALSQDHTPFWVTGLRTWLQECSQLPADF